MVATVSVTLYECGLICQCYVLSIIIVLLLSYPMNVVANVSVTSYVHANVSVTLYACGFKC